MEEGHCETERSEPLAGPPLCLCLPLFFYYSVRLAKRELNTKSCSSEPSEMGRSLADHGGGDNLTLSPEPFVSPLRLLCLHVLPLPVPPPIPPDLLLRHSLPFSLLFPLRQIRRSTRVTGDGGPDLNE